MTSHQIASSLTSFIGVEERDVSNSDSMQNKDIHAMPKPYRIDPESSNMSPWSAKKSARKGGGAMGVGYLMLLCLPLILFLHPLIFLLALAIVIFVGIPMLFKFILIPKIKPYFGVYKV